MRLIIEHRTGYSFSEPQARLVQLLRMTPGCHNGQNVVDWRIDVDCDARLKHGRDGFGNETQMLYVDGPIEHIGITVTGEVLTEDRAGMIAGAVETLPPHLYLRKTDFTTADDGIAAFAREIDAGDGSRLSKIHRLNHELHEWITLDEGRRRGESTAASVFAEGHGAYTDLAHVFIAAARAIGFPARYVSGHLFRREEGAALRETAHGWAEAHVDGMGWIGFDPAMGKCPDDAYVRVSIGLDYRDAAPLSGARTGGGAEELEVGVRVGLADGQARQ